MSDDERPTLDDDDSVTMVDVLAQESRMQEDASAVLGGSDDKECTYPKGYVKRQALYACMTCAANTKEPAAICLACSYSCHEGHQLYELYTKRHFRCDCGNSKFKDFGCQLVPTKSDVNEENQYNQNFQGLYCTCSRPYPDPHDEVADCMIQCIVCEDWFHGRHIGTDFPDGEDDLEMICAGCMARHSFLWAYQVSSSVHIVHKDLGGDDSVDVEGGGESGQIKPAVDETMKSGDQITQDGAGMGSNKSTEAHTLAEDAEQESGRDRMEEGEESRPTKPTVEEPSNQQSTMKSDNQEITKDEVATGSDKHMEASENDASEKTLKRKMDPGSVSAEGSETPGCSHSVDVEPPAKQTKTEKEEVVGAETESGCLLLDLQKRKVVVKNCAAFWKEGWREKLCSCRTCLSMYKDQGVAYLLDKEDTVLAYEERGRCNVQTLSEAEQERSILSGMTRIQQIEMIHGYNEMKSELTDYLRDFVKTNTVVQAEDIKKFFELMAKKKNDRVSAAALQALH